MATTLTPYLAFDGNTRDAFRFYEQALGGTIKAMLTYDDMPKSSTPAEGCDGPAPAGSAIMHACLVLPGGAMLFAGDAPPGRAYEGIKGVMLAVQYDTVDQAHTAFHALSQGGNVMMPLTPTFWAKTFGMVVDRFGVSWGLSGEPLPMA